MLMKNYLAEKELYSIAPEGEPKHLKVGIGVPYKIDEHSWGCACCVEGLYNKLHDAVGVDAWQALTLATKLVEQLLAFYIEDGGKLFWEEGGDEMELNDVIPRHTASNQSPEIDA